MENCETINYCLLLVRNLLHVHTPTVIPCMSDSASDSGKESDDGNLPEKLAAKIVARSAAVKVIFHQHQPFAFCTIKMSLDVKINLDNIINRT